MAEIQLFKFEAGIYSFEDYKIVRKKSRKGWNVFSPTFGQPGVFDTLVGEFKNLAEVKDWLAHVAKLEQEEKDEKDALAGMFCENPLAWRVKVPGTFDPAPLSYGFYEWSQTPTRELYRLTETGRELYESLVELA